MSSVTRRSFIARRFAHTPRRRGFFATLPSSATASLSGRARNGIRSRWTRLTFERSSAAGPFSPAIARWRPCAQKSLHSEAGWTSLLLNRRALSQICSSRPEHEVVVEVDQDDALDG